MFNGDYYPNGSYINHIYITPTDHCIKYLQCMLADTPLIGREWIYPNGQPVNYNNNSNSDPLHCNVFNNPANITVY